MSNAAIFARALFALHESKTLRLKECKPAVKLFIRQSSEDSLWNLSTHYRSAKAKKILESKEIRSASQYHHFCRRRANGLTHEHMVPGEVVYTLITNHSMPSVEAFEEILLITGYRATITQEEDRKLRPSAMPGGFFESRSPMYFNHMARYIEAKLHTELHRRPARGWFPSDA